MVVYVSPETYEGLTRTAHISSKKTGMEIDVNVIVEVACQNELKERSPTGRQVTIHSS